MLKFLFLLYVFLISSLAWSGDLQTETGRHVITQIRNVYSSTNVTTSAWVQLSAVFPGNASYIEIFDSSGQTLTLGFGASGSEVSTLTIFPGGNGVIPAKIPINTRLSIKALSATASTGELDINFYE
jgi:hypothetical protein